LNDPAGAGAAAPQASIAASTPTNCLDIASPD
jgi:hypothetical protein